MRRFIIFLPFFCCLLVAPVVASEEASVHPFLTSKYSVDVGVFSSGKELAFRADGAAGGAGTSVDFDEQFDLGHDEDVFALELTWRFGTKWSLRMQHFELSQDRKAVLEEDIQWGDDVIQAGSSVKAGTNFELTRVFFARSFDTDPQFDYGIGIGLHWLNIGAFIERDLITSFGEISAVKASGPLPNIGTWYYYSPSEKWYIGGRLDWFEASVGDYAGGLVNFAFGANYQLFEHFGVGVKYQIFTLDVDVDKKDWRGRAETEYAGLYLHISGNW